MKQSNANQKVQIRVFEDEWWPVYDIEEIENKYHRKIEVDRKTLNRWKRVFSQFDRIQEEIASFYDNAAE